MSQHLGIAIAGRIYLHNGSCRGLMKWKSFLYGGSKEVWCEDNAPLAASTAPGSPVPSTGVAYFNTQEQYSCVSEYYVRVHACEYKYLYMSRRP